MKIIRLTQLSAILVTPGALMAQVLVTSNQVQ